MCPSKELFVGYERFAASQANNAAKRREEAQKLGHLLGDYGEHDLVLNGLHENVLSQRFYDTYLASTCRVYDSLLDADKLLTISRRTADFGFYAYLPAAFLEVRGVVAEHQDRLAMQLQSLQV